MVLNDLHGKWFRGEPTTLDEVKGILKNSKAKRSEVVEAAAFAPSVEIRHFLIDLANKTKFNLKTGMNDYHLAAISGRIEDYNLAKERGCNPDSLITTSPRGLTYKPIHLAARLNNNEIMEALLQDGVNINSPGKNGESPLATALEFGSNAAAEILISNNADVNHRDHFLQSTPLFNISDNINKEILDSLVEKGADLNARNEPGFPLTWHLLKEKQLKSLQYLVEKGAPVIFENNGCILFAALDDLYHNFGYKKENNEAYIQILDFLVNHQDIDLNKEYSCFDYKGKVERKTTALDIALQETSAEVIEYLLKKGASLPEGFQAQSFLDEGDWILKKVDLLKKSGINIENKDLIPRVLDGVVHPYDKEHEEMKTLFPLLIEEEDFASIKDANGVDMLFKYITLSVAEYDYNRPLLDVEILRKMLNAGCSLTNQYNTSDSDLISEINYKFSNILKRSSYNSQELIQDLLSVSKDDQKEEILKEVLELMESFSGEQVEEADTTSGIGFDMEPYITLSHSIMVENIHYSKIVKTNKWLKKHKVTIIPIGYLGDMEFVKNDSFTCLIGIPIQLTPAYMGPEKIDKKQIAQAQENFTSLDDEFWNNLADLLGTELSPENAKIYLAASGPGAWGRMIKGETGTQEEERPEGKFYLGMDYEQEPHSEGVWGEVLASADAYEWPVEVSKEQLNTEEKIFLVASFD